MQQFLSPKKFCLHDNVATTQHHLYGLRLALTSHSQDAPFTGQPRSLHICMHYFKTEELILSNSFLDMALGWRNDQCGQMWGFFPKVGIFGDSVGIKFFKWGKWGIALKMWGFDIIRRKCMILGKFVMYNCNKIGLVAHFLIHSNFDSMVCIKIWIFFEKKIHF